MLILIDNGHGLATPGKRSPDGLPFNQFSIFSSIHTHMLFFDDL